MTQYTRPDSLPAWAESGAKVQPTNAEIQAGWPATNAPPSRQRFNWIFNWLANAVRYFLQLGVPEWSAAETYVSGARIQFGGATYKAVASSTNVAPDSDPAKWERWGFSLSEINALIAGAPSTTIKGLQLFTSSGTFTVPAGVTEVIVEVWGGGGSGAGSGTGTNGNGGGAGGGYAMKRVTGLTPGASVSVTVGAGGAKQYTAGTAGNPGGTSSFGAHCSSTGGAGGKVGITDAATSHAVGGVGAGGDVNIQGGYGLAIPNSAIGGVGGSSPRGGQGGAFGIAGTATLSDGRDGASPGGGGGGADDAGSAGGAGGAGMVYVRWGV